MLSEKENVVLIYLHCSHAPIVFIFRPLWPPAVIAYMSILVTYWEFWAEPRRRIFSFQFVCLMIFRPVRISRTAQLLRAYSSIIFFSISGSIFFAMKPTEWSNNTARKLIHIPVHCSHWIKLINLSYILGAISHLYGARHPSCHQSQRILKWLALAQFSSVKKKYSFVRLLKLVLFLFILTAKLTHALIYINDTTLYSVTFFWRIQRLSDVQYQLLD